MPTIVRNVDQINGWIKDKQSNEQSMLRKLNDLFNAEVPKGRIADVIMPAIAAMWLEDRLHWEEHHFASPIVSAVMIEEQNLPVWQLCTRGGRPVLAAQARLMRMWEMLRTHDHALTCSHLSELMRVVGAWLEKGGGFAAHRAAHMYEELRRLAPADAARAGAPALIAVAGASLGQGHGFGTPDINKAFRVGPRSIPADAPHGSSALEEQERLDAEAWGGDVRQRDRLEHEIEAHVRDAWVRPAFGMKSGMEMKRADRDDSCRKIDRLFGILVGATISGTTADTAIILEGLGAPRGLHAGYYLFPVATIAAALHHTLLEVALPLALIGAIDNYHVGFYTSLEPKGGLPEELGGAERVLRAGERHQDNRHLVLWYNANGALEGCILWAPNDYDEAKNTLYDAKKMLTRVREMPRTPLQKDVARLVSKTSPLLFERLPVSFKRAAYA